jgi:hypothetical protein
MPPTDSEMPPVIVHGRIVSGDPVSPMLSHCHCTRYVGKVLVRGALIDTRLRVAEQTVGAELGVLNPVN